MRKLLYVFGLLAFMLGDASDILAQAGDFQARFDKNDDGRKPPPQPDDGSPVVLPGGGGGMSDIAIHLDWADMSNMLAKPSELNWRGVESSKGFLVQVGEDVLLSRDFVFSAKTNKTSISIPLHELVLEKGKTYYVKVTDLEDSDNASKKAKFKMINKASLKKAFAQIKDSETFQNANGFKRKMMKAFQLEQEGLMYEAAKMYEAYEKDDDNDATMRNLRDVFKQNAKVMY